MGSKEPKSGNYDGFNLVQRYLLMLLAVDEAYAVPREIWLHAEMYMISQNIEELGKHLDFGMGSMEQLSEKLDEVIESITASGYAEDTERGLRLTQNGEHMVSGIQGELDEAEVETIRDVKRFANDLSRDELLVFIYYTYPDMTVESREFEDIEENRERLANRLYRREKISVEKASELAGKSIPKFKEDIDTDYQ